MGYFRVLQQQYGDRHVPNLGMSEHGYALGLGIDLHNEEP